VGSSGSGTPTATALATAPNPSSPGQVVNLTATVSPSAASGTVTFSDAGNPIGTGTLSGGVAIMSTSTLSAGNHSLTATYGGNATYNASTSPAVNQVVGSAPNKQSSSTSLSVSPNPANVGQPVTLTAFVSPGNATGIVTFTDGAATVGVANVSGG